MHGQDTEKAWKLAVIALVVFFVCALIVTMIVAARKIRIVEPDYYRQGLYYGEQSRSTAKAADWKTFYFLEKGMLRLSLTDSAGIPVAGAEVFFISVTRPELKSRTAKLIEVQPGIYNASLDVNGLTGLNGTIRIKRDYACITEKVALFK
jgi:nitrogen fixation protein FixH